MKLADLLKKKPAIDRAAKPDAAKGPAKPRQPLIDFQQLAQDFRTLDPKDPGLWPLAPRLVILVGLFLGLLGAAWWFGWNVQLEELAAQKAKEEQFKAEWVAKKTQAVNLDEYRRQLAEIDRSFGALLKQLPNQAEIGDLLVDINKAAQGRGLLVELFKPGGESLHDFYAEVPITLTLVGSYHDIGGFAGDIAKLPRIVTLNDLNLTTGSKDGVLTLRTTAKTFRYLDEEELARQKKSKAGKGSKP
jgi:type IV pilus assembly protein PilO